jgi:pyrimidine deaminase RibD-like protein
MPLSDIETAITSVVVGRFMNLKESTKRKDVVTQFKSPQSVDQLIKVGVLRAIDNDGNLAPTALGVECSEDAGSVTRAKSAVEIVLQALQIIYHDTPPRKQITRNDVQQEVDRILGKTVPEVVQRGLYFVKEFPVLDAYGPSPGQMRPAVFDLEWMEISERIVTVDAKNAWHEHVRASAATLESIINESGVGAPKGSQPSGDDRTFALLAIEQARRSIPEDDRVHPRVGAVVVKDGRILALAHRGEIPQCHAEYIALEKKLTDVSLSGATVYTTLEPCTARKHPKVPCAIRLTERKVHRVVIGMLDPDDKISGRGQRALRKAGIVTDFFPHDLMAQVEELNRDFARDRESREDELRDALQSGGGLSESAKPTVLPKVRVALVRGHVSNFLLKYTNDDDEVVFIRQARIFSREIELTEPLTPDDPSHWRVEPHSAMSFGKTITHRTNPAASLVKMNSNAGIVFETEVVVVASCEMRGQLSEVRQTLYVKVNATNNEIVPLV